MVSYISLKLYRTKTICPTVVFPMIHNSLLYPSHPIPPHPIPFIKNKAKLERSRGIEKHLCCLSGYSSCGLSSKSTRSSWLSNRAIKDRLRTENWMEVEMIGIEKCRNLLGSERIDWVGSNIFGHRVIESHPTSSTSSSSSTPSSTSSSAKRKISANEFSSVRSIS